MQNRPVGHPAFRQYAMVEVLRASSSDSLRVTTHWAPASFEGGLEGGDGGFGGPGYEQRDEGSHRVRMLGEDADGIAEEAAFCGVQGGAESVAAGALVFESVHRSDFGIFDFATGIDAAGKDLDGDILGSERVQENVRGDLNFVAEINFTVAVGDGFQLEARPCGFDASAPSGEIAGTGGVVRVQAQMAAMRGEIVFIRVLHDHAMHVEFGAEADDGGFHAVDPLAGQAVGAAFVESGDDFAFEELIESFGFDLILVAGILVGLAFADGPPDFGPAVQTNLPSFIPPAIQSADV